MIDDDVRKLSVKDLVQEIIYGRFAAPARNELMRRAKDASKDVYTIIGEDYFEGRLVLNLTSESKKPEKCARTPTGEFLGAELKCILNSGWDFTGLNRPPEMVKDAISVEGGFYEMKEEELTEAQRKYLRTIRNIYSIWFFNSQKM